MIRIRLIFRMSLVASLTAPWLIAAGCGNRLSATVTGLVTLDGNPIPSGSVVFYPTTGGAAVYGEAGADGRFELRTGTSVGLQPGNYSVTVMHRRGQPSMNMSPAQIDALDITPTKYRRRETTDLQYSIQRGPNDLTIRLSSH